MRGRIYNLWDNVNSSLWFVPSLFVVLAVVLSSILIEVDVALAARQSAVIPWLFSGTADAARTLLSAVAGSLITAISIAISLTMVALQQASAQFTPRLLRQFTASRTNQIVLGAYTGTFIYALLVLRTVRSAEQNTPFVPALSVTLSVILSLVCLALLIYFIHHMSLSLQVSVILDQVRHDLVAAVENLYPERPPENDQNDLPLLDYVRQAETSASKQVIRSSGAGFIRRIDLDTLRHASFGAATVLLFRPKVGDFIARGSVLATLDRPGDAHSRTIIQNAVVLDRERTTHQDALFAIRRLVDIALKALSPGINDPTTAEYALYHLNDALGRIAERHIPSPVQQTEDGHTRIVVHGPTWDDVVDAAFGQICAVAHDDAHVLSTLLDVLYELATRRSDATHTPALQRIVAEVRFHVKNAAWSDATKAGLTARADLVEQVMVRPS